MSRRKLRRPTFRQFYDGLVATGVSPTEFARLTGSNVDRVVKWTTSSRNGGEGDNIPQWVAGFLIALANPETRRQIEEWAKGESK